ncbi:hypothetical protein ACQUQP_01215 [Marinobacterium sp. YM272]|uniref:hypothetical protein n=1 Tax=Marinobacterium sp. YM272 TaxID=3421654 RepID=UPI003D7FE37E
MAPPKHKPLFNRRYLLILVWVLPIMILLLQRGGSESPIDRVQWDGERQAYLLPASRDDILLTLIIPLSQALTDRDWIGQRVRIESLRQQLADTTLQHWLSQQGWQADISQAPTHLRVSLQMQAPPQASQMRRFYSLLTSDVPQTTLAKRARAERYLESRQDEVRLLAALGDRLPAQEASRPETPLWILAGKLDRVSGSTQAPASQSPARSRGWSPGVISLDDRSHPARSYWQLTGHPQPAPTNGAELANQRLDAELVAQLLSRSAAQFESYRWIWKPLVRGGYRALLTLETPSVTDTAPIPALAARLDQALLDTTRDALLERYERMLDESPQQWLELVALYRLPLDSHRAFRDTLLAAELSSAKSRVNDLFNPHQNLQISFITAGNQQ